MPSPSTETPLVPSAGGSLPGGPSPPWQRAAQGLRWMRLAMYTSLVGCAPSSFLALGGASSTPVGRVAVYLPYLISLVACVVYATGLWRFRSVPASTGASRPARQAFACLASWWALALLSISISCLVWFIPARFSSEQAVIRALVFWEVTSIALVGTHLWLLVRALSAALRSLGETPPAWAPKAVAACIAWWILLNALPIALLLLTTTLRGAGSGFLLFALTCAWGIGLVGSGVFALALASVLGRTARALARQQSPDSA
jgi:hypothetical protein